MAETGIRVIKTEEYGQERMIIEATHVFGTRAAIAKDLMEHIAMAMGQVDGEDSAGRQKLRLMRPDEVAKRACEIADHLVDEFESRGWMVFVPDVERLTDEQRRAKRDAALKG